MLLYELTKKQVTDLRNDSTTSTSQFEEFHQRGICWECKMKHFPFCDNTTILCRICNCAKSWHPLNGPCRVGPETEFELHNCYCQGYVPKDNLEYLESLVDKNKNN
jgi:hypothetical protein